MYTGGHLVANLSMLNIDDLSRLAFVSLFTYYMNVYIMSKRAASAGLVDVDVE